MLKNLILVYLLTYLLPKIIDKKKNRLFYCHMINIFGWTFQFSSLIDFGEANVTTKHKMNCCKQIIDKNRKEIGKHDFKIIM